MTTENGAVISPQLMARLLDAWARWDEHPSDGVRANDMEHVCGLVAHRLLVSRVLFRRDLSEYYRKTGDRAQALALVLEDHLAT